MPTARPPFSAIDFKTRFPALDGIRALAVTLVFANHYGGGSHGNIVLRGFNAVRERGGIGVDIFFVLSGFLITGILFDTRHDSQFFKRFFARRSVRIFPVVYLLFAVLLLLTPVFHYKWKWGQAWFLVYLGNFFANHNLDLYLLASPTHPAANATLNHLWSLCVEEQFYFFWPVVVWLVADRVKLIWTSAILCLLTLALRIEMVQVWDPWTAGNWLQRALPFRLDGLLFGALLALLLRGPAADRIQRSMKWVLLAGLIPVLLIFRFSPAADSAWYLTVGMSFTGIASMGLIGMTLRQGSPAFRFFSLRPFLYLGKYSYGFYVWHVVWAAAWLRVLILVEHHVHSLALSGLIVLPTSFCSTLLVAKLSYDLFEVRFLKWKRHFEYDSELRTHKTAFTADGR